MLYMFLKNIYTKQRNLASIMFLNHSTMFFSHCLSHSTEFCIPLTKDFLLRQHFDPHTSTYTYILADSIKKEAVIIDPVLEWVERDFNVIQEIGLRLKYAVNTHVHADHVTGSGKLKSLLPNCLSMISHISGAFADIQLSPMAEIKFGRHSLVCYPTPGHTEGCMTLACEEQGILFTGDTLLIRGCGRTDFQEGCPERLYKSVHSIIYKFPDNFRVFPAHDYAGRTVSTIGEEKRFNPRLTKPLSEFIKIMKNLNLPPPNMIETAVPANKTCGLFKLEAKND